MEMEWMEWVMDILKMPKLYWMGASCYLDMPKTTQSWCT